MEYTDKKETREGESLIQCFDLHTMRPSLPSYSWPSILEWRLRLPKTEENQNGFQKMSM